MGKKLLTITVADPATKRVNGPLVCFSTSDAMVSPQIYVVSEVTLNRPLETKDMTRLAPDDAVVFDALTGLNTTWIKACRRYLELTQAPAPGTVVQPKDPK